MPGTWPFIGRERERATLETVLLQGLSALVVGPAGVGKTRLVAEVAELAGGAGVRVLRVVGLKAASGMAFGAFAPLLEPGTSRVDAAARLHRTIRAMAPVCLVVDDANRLDPASAALVHRLALDGTGVLATMRSGVEAVDAVRRLAREKGGCLLKLEPLSRQEVHTLLEAQLDGQVDARAAHVLAERSGGNPLLLQELTEAALAAEVLTVRSGLWLLDGPLQVGERVADLLPLRLERLSPQVRRLMELLALAEPLSLELVEELGCGDATEEAEEARLITPGPEGLRLGHPLYGEILLSRLPLRRKARHLLQLAHVVGARPDELSLIQAVRWRLDAGSTVDTGELLRASRLARRVSIGLAERFARAALAAAPGPDEPLHDQASLELADLLLHDQRPEEAEELWSTLDLSRLDGQTALLVTASRAMALSFAPNRPLDALRLLDAASSLPAAAPAAPMPIEAAPAPVEAAPTPVEAVPAPLGAPSVAPTDAAGQVAAEHPLLATLRATAWMRDGRLSPAAELGELLARDERLPPQVRMPAALTAVASHAVGGRPESALRLVEATASLIGLTTTDMPEAAESMRLLTGLAHRRAGRLDLEQVASEQGYAAALAEGRDADRQQYAKVLGQLATLRGRPRAGARLLREAYAGSGLWFRANLQWMVAELSTALALAGQTAQAREVLQRGRAAPECRVWTMDLLVAEAEIEAAEGAVSVARRLARQAGERAMELGQGTAGLTAWHSLIRFGDATAANACAAAAGTLEGPLARAVADHARALAGQDGEALEAVSVHFGQMGLTWYEAEARAQAVRAWRAAGRQGSAAVAAERLRSTLERCEPLHSPALAGGQSLLALTRRESEIALLAAAGLSDKSIAERLNLSVRTVGTHLTRSYAKLGVASRDELRSRLLTSAEQRRS